MKNILKLFSNYFMNVLVDGCALFPKNFIYSQKKENDRIDFKTCFPKKMKYKIFDPILRYEIFKLYSVYSNTSQDKFTSSDTLTRPNFISIPNIYSLLTSKKENLCSTSIVNRDTF